jgi:hypothetical protein
LKVCLISAEYPPETGWGGIATYTHALAHGLADHGHTVHVLAVSLGQRDEVSMDARVHLHRLAVPTWSLPAPIRRRAGGLWRLLHRSVRVARYLAELDRIVGFDVIEAPNWGAEAAVHSVRARTPLIIRITTPVVAVAVMSAKSERRRFGLRLHHYFEGLPVRRAACVIAPSRFIAEVAEREYRVPAGRLQLVPYGLPGVCATGSPRSNTDTVAPPATDDVSRRLAERTVLFVGRLERRKGIRDLLDAIPTVVEAVPHARFRLVGRDVGDGPGGASYDTYFAAFAPAEARAAVMFVGRVDQVTLEHEYAACDVFAAPSLFESFGLVHFEAMTHGKPVVAYRTSATPEIVVEEETGLLVPPGSPQALAEAIIRLLRRPDEARRMGEQGRARAAANFSLERMVDGTLAVYDAVIRQC